MLKFLADENCDFVVIRALRSAGHDVLAISESYPGAEDTFVIELAINDNRILLTEDKDFGQLTYAYSAKRSGVILIRYPSAIRSTLGNDISQFVKRHEEKLKGTFVVIQPGRARFTKMK
jgi:predicted nuclease of predicted toxin-antitoxin system